MAWWGMPTIRATLPSGARLTPLPRGRWRRRMMAISPRGVGPQCQLHEVVEAYQVKKQIDLQAFNTLALYQTAYNNTNETLPDPTLTPALDFYDEYVWSSRGGTQEVAHLHHHLRRGLLDDHRYHQYPEKYVFNIELIATTAHHLRYQVHLVTTTQDTTNTATHHSHLVV